MLSTCLNENSTLQYEVFYRTGLICSIVIRSWWFVSPILHYWKISFRQVAQIWISRVINRDEVCIVSNDSLAVSCSEKAIFVYRFKLFAIYKYKTNRYRFTYPAVSEILFLYNADQRILSYCRNLQKIFFFFFFLSNSSQVWFSFLFLSISVRNRLFR